MTSEYEEPTNIECNEGYKYELLPYPVDGSTLQQLVNLRLNAFGISPEEGQAKMESANKNNHRGTFSVLCRDNNNRIVGELTLLNPLSRLQRHKIAGKILEHPILEPLTGQNNILGILSIAVDPEHQNRHVALSMLKKADEELSPKAIIGGTKNPALVVSCQKALGGKYDIYYGPHKITDKGKDGYKALPTTAKLLSKVLRLTSKSDGPFILEDTASIKPDIPSVSEYPEVIQSAFADVIRKQEELGNTQTVTAPLILLKR